MDQHDFKRDHFRELLTTETEKDLEIARLKNELEVRVKKEEEDTGSIAELEKMGSKCEDVHLLWRN